MAIKKSEILNIFSVALISLSIYQPVSAIIEYTLTEFFLVFLQISGTTKALMLIIILSLVNCCYLHFSFTNKLRQKTVFSIFLLSLIFGFSYYKFYQNLQNYPRIYEKKPDWTIQGSQILITGKNFGGTHEPGLVYIMNESLQLDILEWSNKKIIAEQPITNNYGEYNLYVVNAKNNKSNPVTHFIKNPSQL